MYYAIYCEDNPTDNIVKRKSIRPAHLSRLTTLEEENRLLTAGPLFLQDGDNPNQSGIYGSLIIAKFDSLADAKAWAAADPYVTAGIYNNINIHPYKKI